MKFLKRLARAIIRRSTFLQRLINKLYAVAFPEASDSAQKPAVELVAPQKKDPMITEKALYSGYSVDYLNSILLTKEQRILELKRLFYNNCGYYLDMDDPKTFNQKLQWLKMNYYDERLSRCVDKAEFKSYVTEQLGEGYVVPMYGVWDSENAIDFDALPQTFVLKSTLQSDGRHIIVVKDKSKMDIDRIKTVMSSWLLPRNSLCSSYCCAYSSLRPRILAEEYITNFDKALVDYKFMCFNGKVEMLFVVADRGSNMGLNFYDLDWNLLPFTRKYPNTVYPLKKPKKFDEMLRIAGELCKPFPFVRVDFYESPDGEQIYVGELTFYPGGGYEKFEPIEWDYKLGEMLLLPEKNI